MYLRYWALTAAIAGLTYLALSYVLFPVWAVAGGAWIGTFVGFIGVVLSGRDPQPRARLAENEAATDAGNPGRESSSDLTR
jgi:hypothetical protein